MSTAKATIDHDTIKRWVEEHGGCPAHVKRSGAKSDPGILRIDFPGYSGKQSLERISWDSFFDAFEQNELAFLYQDEEGSRFSKFVSRDSADLDGQSASGADGRASSRGRAASSAAGKTAAARSSRSTSSRGKSAASGSKASPKRKTSATKSRGASSARGSSAAKSSSTRSRSASSTRSRSTASRGKSASSSSAARGRANGRSTKAAGKRAAANGGRKSVVAEGAAPDALTLLSEQHREVEGLFEKLESARGTAQKERLFAKLADALAAHAKIEEEIFYPSVFSKKTETELRESVEEHLVVKRLVADMLAMQASNPQFMSKASVLKEVVRHHVEEEEHQLFPEVRAQGEEDLDELGGRLQERYEQLMAREPRKQVPKEARAATVPF
jgi:hemerythrin superfamily protein